MNGILPAVWAWWKRGDERAAPAPSPQRSRRTIASASLAPIAIIGPETASRGRTRAAERLDAVAADMLRRHRVRVRRWRTSMSGIAWLAPGPDGELTRWIEAPQPKGPMSAAVFLHEVGHHAIGIGRFRPRCLEEYHAWAWSLAAMRECGITVTEAVERRVRRSLEYAVAKAARRGIRTLPRELLPYVPRRSRG